METYGKELILDMRNCTPLKTRASIKNFLDELCTTLGMEQGDLCFWDYVGFPEEYAEAPPEFKGTSVVQFIMPSNITLHVLDDLKTVYLNVFSCQDFDSEVVKTLVLKWFGGEIVNEHLMDRV